MKHTELSLEQKYCSRCEYDFDLKDFGGKMPNYCPICGLKQLNDDENKENEVGRT